MNHFSSDCEDVVEHGLRRFVVTLAVVIGAVMEIIDTTIVNVALPNIQGNVGASQQEGTFVVTGYIVANIVVIPMSPWLQKRFGRRQYFFASIALFTFASAMCGFSQDLTSLVFWRVVQGIGGGGLLSQAQAILRETFPADKQATAQGIFAIGAMLGPTIGPLLGGLITDNATWPWCFFVNIPLGIFAGAVTLALLRNPECPKALPVDGFGLLLLAVGLGSLQYVLDQGEEKDWFSNDTILRLTIAATISLISFLIWELRVAKTPIVDLTIFRYSKVAAGCLLALAIGVTLLGSLVTLPQYAQGPLGFSATLSGELISVRALPVLFFTPLAARLASNPRVDPRLQIGIGFLLIGISNLLVAGYTTSTASFGTFVPSLLLGGIGLSQVFVPLSILVFASVPASEASKASAMFNLARQLGGSLATALLITLLDRSSAAHQTRLAANANLRNPAVTGYVRGANGQAYPGAIIHLTELVSLQAQVLGYADTSRCCAFVTFAFSPLVLILARPRSRAQVLIGDFGQAGDQIGSRELSA